MGPREDEYVTQGTSRVTAEVEDIVLSEQKLTRKILRALVVDNVHDADARVRGAIMHQRRASPAEEWNDPESFNLATLKAGQEVRLTLDCAEVMSLYHHLEGLYAIAAAGVPQGNRRLTVVDLDEVYIARGRARETARKLLDQEGEQLWQLLEELAPEPFEAVIRAKVQRTREIALHEFEDHLTACDWSEGQWEAFFRRNTWIFGQGLAYQFLSEIEGQPYYGGKTITGAGGQTGDYLFATQADVRFTVVVDIKKPETELLGKRRYRNKVWELGEDLTGGVAQVQSNCRTLVIDGSRQEDTAERMRQESTYTYQPKGILLIGHTRQLDSLDKKMTFELFRRNLTSPEIITYDELFERARFIVQAKE